MPLARPCVVYGGTALSPLVAGPVHGVTRREEQQGHRQRDVDEEPAVKQVMQALLVGELTALVGNGLQFIDRLVERRRQRQAEVREQNGGRRRRGQLAPG